jgi:hypothetical protein
MAQSLVLTGANIKLYINNKVYKEVQSISFSIDYGEKEIYGIDALYPQEIAPSKISVRGSVSGIRVKLSGGLQAVNLRALFQDAAAGSYISLRITDRYSGEDIIFIPNAKVTRESHTIATKSTYKLNFDFIGQIPLMALDRS